MLFKNKLYYTIYLFRDDLDQSQGGNIFYQFDGSDDWDEEDPDDDLDI